MPKDILKYPSIAAQLKAMDPGWKAKDS